MDFYIRRNRDIQFRFEVKDPRALEEMLTELTPSQKAEMEAADRERKAVEEKVWQYIEANHKNDLSGNPITRETHEIGYDYDWREREDGLHVGVPVVGWIRPKKSEYDL